MFSILASEPASFFTVKVSMKCLPMRLLSLSVESTRENAAKRVVFTPLVLMFFSMTLSPYISALSRLAMAATEGSFLSATMRAASAVFGYSCVRYFLSWIYAAHWESACWWLTTSLTVAGVAPSTPSRFCTASSSSTWFTKRSPENMRSVTAPTSPAELFSSGSTAASASPEAQAEYACSKSMQGTSVAEGNIFAAAMEAKAPGTPEYATFMPLIRRS